MDLLAIFHYVVGGLTALFACIPLIHVTIGIFLLTGDMSGPNPPPAAVGWLFIVLGSAFSMGGWTLAAFMIAAGRRLKQRRSRTFCMVVAGIECLVMPFGTVLGVLTLILLNKESAAALFDLRN